uniref:RING-type domain-containing protein n=1 Tax=Kalanchoe fedtschenkoi TaxID=63787 RepID=A0A7N0TIM4_KALFE
MDSNMSPGVVTAILVLSVTIIVSICLCLLIRCLILRCTTSANPQISSSSSSSATARSFSSTSRVTPHRPLIDSLPLFTFDSITSGVSPADCAVCLSAFEPHDQLLLLPICCHAFHAQCLDAWLQSNQTKTCPLCRSIIFASEDEILSKVLAASALDAPPSNGSFRIEIGSISRHPRLSSDLGASHRSSTYSLGSFDYVIEAESELSPAATHTRTVSHDKDDITTTLQGHSGASASDNLAAEVGRGGISTSLLRDYVDRLSATISSRTLSFRSSGRFFGGSHRRDDVAGEYDVEANRAGEEISVMFRWFSGV